MGKPKEPRMPKHWRGESDLAAKRRVLFLSRTQQADRIDGAGGLARQHGLHVAGRAPGKLVGCSGIVVKGLDVLQGLDRESCLAKGDVAGAIEDVAPEGVEQGVQGDVTLQARRQPQSAGAACRFPDLLPAAA